MFRERLATEFAPFAVLSSDQLDRLEEHYSLLAHWNQKLNLTRIRDLEEAVRFNYCESLFLGQVLPPGPLRIVDVGSGAGFPGIPLAILRPECSIDLVESHHRKAVFLREASRQLPNVNVISARAESLTCAWDWAISRAVRSEDVIKLRLSCRFAVLMTQSELSGLPEPIYIVPSPWGSDRIAALFHVEQRRSTRDLCST